MKILIPRAQDTCKDQSILWKYLSPESRTPAKSTDFTILIPRVLDTCNNLSILLICKYLSPESLTPPKIKRLNEIPIPTPLKINRFSENTYPQSSGHLPKWIDFMKIPIPRVPDTCKNQQILWKYVSPESPTPAKTNRFYENTYPQSLGNL